MIGRWADAAGARDGARGAYGIQDPFPSAAWRTDSISAAAPSTAASINISRKLAPASSPSPEIRPKHGSYYDQIVAIIGFAFRYQAVVA
jgi:hypothetical protein